MKTKIISDIHLEFGLRNFDFSACDLLILAGDIHVGHKGIDWINSNIKNIPVIYVLGNHEYYKHAYPKLLNKLKGLTKGTNIHILENESIVINDCTFHGTTLWTDFDLFGNMAVASFECEQSINDYTQIQRSTSYSRLRASDTRQIHYESLQWLHKSLSESTTEKNIVITHQAPSMLSISKKYKTDILSAAFASNLDAFILETKPNFWIHGHVHNAFDYMIGSTRVICNPAGYPFETNNGFQEHLIVDI